MANTVTPSSDDELRRRRDLEEALEVKSLRRIIGAYLNYPEASEEDIRRYERSFRRLPPAHKALLSHLPLKFQKLRRCISKNSYFIFSMLQAFEPPLDLSQDIDTCEHQNLKNVPDRNEIHDEENVSSSQSASTSGRASVIKPDEKLLHVNGSTISEHLNGNSLNSNNDATVDSVVDPRDACPPQPDWLDSSFEMHVPLVDVDKVRCVIRNIVRDWAAEGQKERDQCYKPILEELEAQFPDRRKGSPPACLIPGAGLGRLALEISSLGFISQGNEFSYYMMICSSFILNHADTAEEWTIYPWIHTNCNSLSDSDQLRPVTVPDIHPASAGITEGFSMCGGDFVEVYSDPNQVAHNIVEYIEIISKILKDGGVWINLGPLLYHFADMYGHEDEMSVELSLEDVKRVALHYGFQIEKETMIETTYTTNPLSMMQNRYFTAFWTMRKRESAEAVKQVAS